MVSTLQVNGARGELTPLMHARVDTDFYQSAYAECLNTVVTRYGPHTRVPGTLWYGDTKTQDKKSRMLPFEFSETQLYAIEFGHQYVRFWTPEGQVFSGMSPYEIVSPYVEDDLPYLHGRQAGDELYLWCNGKRPQILKRAGETNWSFVPYAPKDGPYMDINSTTTTLTPSDVGSATPIMTSDTTPAGFATSSSAGANSWQAFTRNRNLGVVISSTNTGLLTVQLNAPTVVDNYFLIAPPDNHYTDAMFSQWDLQGSISGSEWISIDSRDKEEGWAGSEIRFFETDNKQAYQYYRLQFSGGGSTAGSPATSIGGLYLHNANNSLSLTASSTAGINDNTGFKPTDVGRAIRLLGPEGKWRWFEITGYTSPTVVVGRLNGQQLLGAKKVKNWKMGAWSDTDGWARTGRFFEDRLAQAGWAKDPVGMALSVSADYDNFRVSDPLVDDDGITLRMTGGKLDIVQWLSEAGTLLAGTGGGIRSIGGRDNTAVLKHDNLRQRLETSTAGSRVQPTTVDNNLLFMDRPMRRLYEMGYDYQSDGYRANEVSVLNDHLFKRGIEQVDYADTPYCTALARRSDGKVIFFTYDRGQKIAGGTLCDFGGFVEDIMVMGGRTYPDVWLTVLRTVNGSPRRFIERLAPYWDGQINPDDMPVYAASARQYDDTPATTLTGLGNLAGETVGIWADGKDIGDATVTVGGDLTLPFSISAERVVVGKRMQFRIKTLRLPTTQSPDGPGLGKRMRIAKASVDVYETARIYAGSERALELLRDEDYSEHDPDNPEPILTTVLKIGIDDSFKNSGVLVIQGDSMYPATIRAISLEVEGEP